jgi:hypothetical protein
MSRVARFLTERRSEIMAHLEEPAAAERLRELPSPGWWIVIAVVCEISTHVSECVSGLQGRRGTLQQQTCTVHELLTTLTRFAFVKRIAEAAEADSLENMVILENWQVCHSDLVGFIQDQGVFAIRTFDGLDTEGKEEVVQAVGQILLTIVAGLSSVEAIRDDVNDANTDNGGPSAVRLDAARNRIAGVEIP